MARPDPDRMIQRGLERRAARLADLAHAMGLPRLGEAAYLVHQGGPTQGDLAIGLFGGLMVHRQGELTPWTPGQGYDPEDVARILLHVERRAVLPRVTRRAPGPRTTP